MCFEIIFYLAWKPRAFRWLFWTPKKQKKRLQSRKIWRQRIEILTLSLSNVSEFLCCQQSSEKVCFFYSVFFSHFYFDSVWMIAQLVTTHLFSCFEAEFCGGFDWSFQHVNMLFQVDFLFQTRNCHHAKKNVTTMGESFYCKWVSWDCLYDELYNFQLLLSFKKKKKKFFLQNVRSKNKI